MPQRKPLKTIPVGIGVPQERPDGLRLVQEERNQPKHFLYLDQQAS